MARWLAKLKLSVRQPTMAALSVSKACSISISLAVVFTWLRCTLRAYQVWPMHRRRMGASMSW